MSFDQPWADIYSNGMCMLSHKEQFLSGRAFYYHVHLSAYAPAESLSSLLQHMWLKWHVYAKP